MTQTTHITGNPARPPWLGDDDAERTSRATVTWTAKDAALYALGVGAAADDPAGSDLRFVTEGPDRPQLVLPTFAAAVGVASRIPALEGCDRAKVVHGEQAVRLFVPLPASTTIDALSSLLAVYDKGSGALAVIDTLATEASTGVKLFQTTTSLFVRDAGGFGGDRGPSPSAGIPDRAPDDVITAPTRSDQALLYQLSGDHNPLHWDPDFARQAGFDRPILHGLCTFGFVGRALINAVCGGQPEGFGYMSGRFSRPGYPGDTLVTSLWDEGGTTHFRVANQRDVVLIDHGRFQRRGDVGSSQVD